MEEAVSAGIMAGGQGVIVRNGETVFNEIWGKADREKDRPMQADSLYRIYSMTKPITSVALLMLYEEGHFLLEDPIALYLPEYAGVSVHRTADDGTAELEAPLRPPTIRDLLRHSAGMSYGIFGDSAVDQAYREAELFLAPTLEEFSNRVAKIPLLFHPGQRWHYSVSVDIQGRLIEAISGQSLGEFFRERVFEPLGMIDTFFTVPVDKRDRLTQLYSPVGTRLDWETPWQFTTELRLEPADPELTRNYLEGHLFESGGGGLVSTSADYLRFALMLANEGILGEERLLAPGTVRLLQSDHVAGMDQSALQGLEHFGLGVGIVGDAGGKSGELGAASAYGWGGAAGTVFWVDPDENIVGLFLTQSVPHQTPLGRKFRVLTYQALIE